jgi:adenylate cyclase
VCYAPFRGIGGRIVRLIGFAPSRKNPRLCSFCFEKAPLGGVEMEIGVLFADIRGFTSASETRSAEQTAALVNRFYAAAAQVLVDADAIIDKLVGDEVMALFVPFFTGVGFVAQMVRSAEELLEAVGYGSAEGPWISLGIGMDFGVAFVGNVGAGDVKDFTAIGDVVNTAARLQGAATTGQIVMSERVYRALADGRRPMAEAMDLQLKGKLEPVRARVIDRFGDGTPRP